MTKLSKKTITSIAIGAVAGAAFTMLFTTKKGKRIRTKIKNTGNEIGKKTKEEIINLTRYSSNQKT